VKPDEMLADPTLDARARVLSEGLRCMVCQNRSIDESDADLAHDLRILVRQASRWRHRPAGVGLHGFPLWRVRAPEAAPQPAQCLAVGHAGHPAQVQ
jgi:hypothetical protein